MKIIERLEATLAGEPTDRPPVAVYQQLPLSYMSGESSGTAAFALAEYLDLDIAVMPFLYGFPHRDKLSFDRPLDLAELENVHGNSGQLAKQLAALNRMVKGCQGRRWVLQEVPSPWKVLVDLAGRDLVFRTWREYQGFLKKSLEAVSVSLTSFVRCAMNEGAQGILFRNPSMSFDYMNQKDYQLWGLSYDRAVLAAAKESKLTVHQYVGPKPHLRDANLLGVNAIGWSCAVGPKFEANEERWSGFLWGGIDEREAANSLMNWNTHLDQVLRDGPASGWIFASGEPLPGDMSLSKLDALKDALARYRRPRPPRVEDPSAPPEMRRPRKPREERERPEPRLLTPPKPPKGTRTRIVDKPEIANEAPIEVSGASIEE